MASNSFGTLFRYTTWGESHGPAVGVVIDGVPSRVELSEADIQQELDRRRPGQSKLVTQRQEADRCEILSGVFRGLTTGAPVSVIVRNTDAQSAKYDEIEHLYRPGHADYVYDFKYGHRDHRGGGRSSARETVGRVAAGAIARKILAPHGIRFHAGVISVRDIVAAERRWDTVEQNPVRCPDPEAAGRMAEAIDAARKSRNSLGGVVELVISGLPAGIGEPIYDKLDALLAYGMMTLNAVKGVEIGAGFASTRMTGLENNDEMETVSGKPVFRSNHAGGILAGISTGQDVIVRVAIKPTASIAQDQHTIDRNGENGKILVEGRHDPCLCPRAVPVIEAIAAVVVCDLWLRVQGYPVAGGFRCQP
ncbi:MAG: chorismate synthase [Deltaproteobacteria bacterium]|nr:chorismate synthase [Deltaproteobacteria bacterium]